MSIATDRSASPARQRSTLFAGPKAETVLGSFVVIALVVLILAPLGAVLLQAFMPGALTAGIRTATPAGLFDILNRPLWAQALMNSLKLSLFAAVLGGAIGTSLAFLRHRIRMLTAGLIDLSAWLILILPSFVIAQGWMLFAGRAGIANQWLGLSFVTDAVFNPYGLAVVMSLKAFPLAYLAVSAGLQWRLDDLSHAASLSGATPARVFRTVHLPLLMPAVLSGCVLIFIDVVGDFGLPAALATTYRFPTLTYAIYVAINQSPIRFDQAGILAFYVTVLLLLAVYLYFHLIRRRRFDFLTARARQSEPSRSTLGWLADLYATVIMGLALLVPLGASLVVSLSDGNMAADGSVRWTLANYQAVFEDTSRFAEALGNSLAIAGGSAVCAAITAFMAAYVLTFSNFGLNRLIDLTCTLSLAVPGVVLGIGYIFIWNSPFLDGLGLSLYGHPAILILAGTAGAIPFAIRIMLGAFAQLPANMLNAAAMNGAGLLRRLATIVIPLTAIALISATLAAFGSAVFDLAINSILRPPRLSVLPVYVNRAFEQGEFGVSTAATFVAGGVTVAIILVLKAVSAQALAFGRPRTNSGEENHA
jgi:iron(III) transport system permease protein